MKILLIDDESMLLEELTDYLSTKHTVVSATNGQDGWEVFTQTPNTFDVILSDIKMPVCDGIQFLQRLRQEDYKTPIVFMTGHGGLQNSIQALQHGAFDFILKPFRLKSLDAVLAKIEALYTTKQQLWRVLPQIHSRLDLSITSHTNLIPAVVQYLQNHIVPFCEMQNLEPYKIGLCLVEAITNAVIHGNLGISSDLREKDYEGFSTLISSREADPEFSEKSVEIYCKLSSTELIFEIQDQGEGFNWKNIPVYDPLSLLEYGRGLLIIENTMDHLTWNDSGNRIIMTKSLNYDAP